MLFGIGLCLLLIHCCGWLASDVRPVSRHAYMIPGFIMISFLKYVSIFEASKVIKMNYAYYFSLHLHVFICCPAPMEVALEVELEVLNLNMKY